MKNLIKKTVLILGLTSLASVSKAQYTPPLFGWSNFGSNTGSFAYSDGIKCDNLGNIYITGRKAGTFSYGGMSILAGGGTPIFNGKLNATTGAALWLNNSYSSGGFDYPYGASIDNLGNVWSTGTSNSGSGSIFLSKTNNSTGAVMFNINLPTTGSGRATASDAFGNTYITGVSNGNINFGFGMLTAMGGSDVFLAKYNSAGTCLWAVKCGGAGFDQANGLACDPSGNVYMVGGYTGVPSFGGISLPASGAYPSFFIAKYNPAGTCLYASSATNAGIVANSWWESNEVTVDPCGNAYVAGHFQTTANFGGGITLTSAGGDDSFIAKFSNTGVCRWAERQGSSAADQGQSIAIDLDGDAYIIGSYAGTLGFSNAGPFTLASISNRNTFIAKYCGGNGALVWAQRISGSPTSYVDPGAVTVDNAKNTFFLGHYSGNAIIGTNTLATSPGNTYIYTGKITPGTQYTIDPFFPASMCSGACTTIPYTAAGPFQIPNVFTAQLSDAAGSFTAPLTVGSITSTTSGSITICIPSGVTPGNTYRLRIVSSAPVYCSRELCNVTFSVIAGSTITTVANQTAVCVGQTNASITLSGALSYTTQPGSLIGASLVVSPSVATIYTVSGSSLNGCISTKTIQIGINPTTTATANNPTVCAGSPINLTAGGGTAFVWNGPVSFTSNIQNPIIPVSIGNNSGSYSVVVTNSFGCTGTAIANVSVTVVPPATITSNAIPGGICFGKTLNLIGTGGGGAATYVWTGPNSFTANGIQNPTIVNVNLLANGVYSLVTTVNTCTAMATSTVIVNPLPTPVLNHNAPICLFKSLSFNASGGISYTIAGPYGYVTNNPIDMIPVVNNVSAGVYTLTVSDANGCVNKTTSTVVINQLPIISTIGSSVCANKTITLSVTGGTSFVWSGPLSFTSNAQLINIPNATSAMGGQYAVKVTDANGCTTTSVTNVSVYALPTPTASANTPICFGKEIKLSGSDNIGANYLWQGPNGYYSIDQNATIGAAETNMSGTYTLTVSDDHGCSGTTTTNMLINALPNANIVSTNNKGCVPVCVTFSCQSTNSLQGITWKLDNQTTLGAGVTVNNCFKDAGTYSIKALFTDVNGCSNLSSSYQVEAYPIPVADFNVTSASAVVNEEVELTDASHNAVITEWTWNYTEQKTNISFYQNAKVVYQNEGAYPVALTVKSDKGCSNTIVKAVKIGEDFGIYIPNSFTPNGDGLNDIFQPKAYGVTKYAFEVFDRWGSKVFATNNFEEGWNGKDKGEEIKDGTYVWKVSLTNVHGKAKDLSGIVTVLK